MDISVMEATARYIVSPGKGILAADESTGTIKKRFDTINVASTEESRRSYRELLFTTPGVEKYVSGVILYDETIRQKSSSGVPLAKILADSGQVPGIKVDKGAKSLAGHPGELVTEGLDGLRERLAEYKDLGARFAKWRAVIDIGPGIPTRACVQANAHALARYAALCQEADIVPIVEPEVLMDGAHDIETCAQVTEWTLRTLFAELYEAGVALEGALLKPNMVLPGKKAPKQASPEEIAAATVKILRRAVPAALPGIVFLSGGQTPQQATENLNAMNAMGAHPWELSFSYGRALQEPVLKTWSGLAENTAAAQSAYLHRAWCNSEARFGRYTSKMENQAVSLA